MDLENIKTNLSSETEKKDFAKKYEDIINGKDRDSGPLDANVAIKCIDEDINNIKNRIISLYSEINDLEKQLHDLREYRNSMANE